MLIMDSNLDFEIVIVDDSSPDNTAEVAKQLQQAFPDRIILKQRTGKLGLGTAYVHARM
jgi:dolichol-phosphate mannosyltransferase